MTRDDWDALDRARASFVERKRAERIGIALTSLLIWARAPAAPPGCGSA
ncbi:MAG: hypothetical protein HS111_17590 [Kofleriaceae bacterium]|nr:hypothetical protein [Kofleriaceae bacterium]